MEFLNENKRRFPDLTDEEKGKLLVAFYEGRTIQEWWDDEKGQEWEDVEKNCYDPPEWEYGIWRIKPEPVKQVHWCNDYEDESPSWWYPSREEADSMAEKYRIAVIRREIVDGVVSYFKEDV